jgi:hypothetical protein
VLDADADADDDAEEVGVALVGDGDGDVVLAVGDAELAVGDGELAVGDAEVVPGADVLALGVGVGVAVGVVVVGLGVGVALVGDGDAEGDDDFTADGLGDGAVAATASHDSRPTMAAVTVASAVPAVMPRTPQQLPVTRTLPAAMLTIVRRARAKRMGLPSIWPVRQTSIFNHEHPQPALGHGSGILGCTNQKDGVYFGPLPSLRMRAG